MWVTIPDGRNPRGEEATPEGTTEHEVPRLPTSRLFSCRGHEDAFTYSITATMHFTTAIRSRTGGRDKNQDAADHFESGHVFGWALADGLGGHRGGGLAASLATQALLETCRKHGKVAPDTLRAATDAAQSTLQERQRQHFEYSQMRTTAVLLVANTKRQTALWSHVGDSRLYLFRDGAVVARTTDHSAAQAMVEAGDLEPDAVRFHQSRHRLTRALGDSGRSKPDIAETTASLQADDAFLLCSDGFWEGLTESEMIAELESALTPDAWLEAMQERIEESDGEPQDNYTAVAMMVNGNSRVD